MPTNFNFGQPSNSGGGATAYADAGQGGTSSELMAFKVGAENLYQSRRILWSKI
jgi:hypothetical protein